MDTRILKRPLRNRQTYKRDTTDKNDKPVKRNPTKGPNVTKSLQEIYKFYNYVKIYNVYKKSQKFFT